MSLRVAHVSFSDMSGGAGRAAWRLHQALRDSGLDSRLIANDVHSGDWTVSGPSGALGKLAAKIRSHAGHQVTRLQKSANPVLHSPALIPGRLSNRLVDCHAKVAHLHWINGEMCSIAEIGRISRMPTVWTLHDMWPFCGSEHYTTDERWRDGYRRDNRTDDASGLDVDYWTWNRKRRHWQHPIQLVAPSRWLAECARTSALTRDWPVEIIPNAIDLSIWRMRDRTLAREMFNLPRESKLVLFGAMGGTTDPRKGSDLLLGALKRLAITGTKLELVVFGQRPPEKPENIGFPIHYVGHFHDEVALTLLHSAADVFVLPSRQDNLPNTGVEAQASGRPVVAFDTGGLPDIVKHMQTGYLARPFDVDDLARGIAWVLQDDTRWDDLSAAARDHAESTFASHVVAARYTELYEKLLGT